MARAPEWDEAAFRRWLDDPLGPVRAELLPRIGAETSALAKADFHRRSGRTADSITWETGTDGRGPYARIGGSYVIRFLEHPARQMHHAYRWLSDALREVVARR